MLAGQAPCLIEREDACTEPAHGGVGLAVTGREPGPGAQPGRAGEAMHVADLGHKDGRQHRPHPEQLDQAGVGLGDHGLDAPLDCCDSLIQATHVGDQVSGQLVAGDRRLAGGRDHGQQHGGALGGEVRRAPPGTRSISSRWSRLMVWVRTATRSSRRLVNRCNTTA
jgi:hypothetical protein